MSKFTDAAIFMEDQLRMAFCLFSKRKALDIQAASPDADIKILMFNYLSKEIYDTINLPQNYVAKDSLLATSQFAPGCVAREMKISGDVSMKHMSAYTICHVGDRILKRIIYEEIKELCNTSVRNAFIATVELAQP